MKRASHLIAKIAEIDNLYLAFWKARKGKDGQLVVEEYRKDLQANLLLLRTQLLQFEVNVGHYHYFTIYDPKERIICAASFHERVLHHALMNICHPIFEDFQISDSYATRIDKGTYAALHRAEYFQKKYKWFLKLDVRKYFDSIDQQVLLGLLERRFKEKGLQSIFKQIISSYAVDVGKGVPIGNLTSQYFANYYLAYADRLVKERLKIPAYVRYMDDMVLWHNDKAVLKKAGKALAFFLKDELKLDLKVWNLNYTEQGLSFVGYRVFPGVTRLNKRSKARFARKMKSYWYKLEMGIWSQEEYQNHVLPLLAFASHASTEVLRRKIIKKMGNCQGL